jgi:hypothetical protein
MDCPLCESTESIPVSVLDKDREYLKCVICGLYWLHSGRRLAPDLERERYLQHENDTQSPDYLDYLARLARPVVSLVNPGARGLDFGCGPVEGMKALLEPDFFVDSYDPFFFPKLSKGAYDFLLCCEAAEHFYAPSREFGRMDALLKRGAIIGISSQLVPENFSAWYYRRDPTHVSFYGEDTVQWIATNFGWQLLELRSPLWLLKKS